MSNIASAYEDFATVLAASNIPLDLMQVGDYNAIRNAESVSMMIRANIFSKMGDCARVWRDLRNLNYYKPEQNTVQPAPESAAVANKTVTGTPKKKPVNKTDNRALAKNVKVETINPTEIMNNGYRLDYDENRARATAAQEIMASWNQGNVTNFNGEKVDSTGRTNRQIDADNEEARNNASNYNNMNLA